MFILCYHFNFLPLPSLFLQLPLSLLLLLLFFCCYDWCDVVVVVVVVDDDVVVKEALSVLVLCAPVFIFTSGSSALLWRPRCGLSI